MKQLHFDIAANAQVPFNNRVDFCVGTGRMGLALQKEYQDELALVQQEIGFKHIRGHGLFHDDMAIYQEYEDETGAKHAEYNFTYLDRVMDAYRRLGLRPFLELGFMPKKLASGTQTMFYWASNVTPPADYEAWCALVQATLRHLMDRYGADDVVTWPVEVWNEPNLEVFWEHADMDEYFRLFARTFRAVKAVDERFQVGGPAICGVDDKRWLRCFLEFCRAEGLRPDHITRHHYTIEPPERDGHYGYPKLSDPETCLATLQASRDIVDSFAEFCCLPTPVTEFYTSYSPTTPLHDTNLNAAYIAHQLSRLGDCNESYSYWTFGDVFEESGVPFTPFYGGFGLVADHCIPKPTFWTFAFFKKLQGTCVHRSQQAVVVRGADGRYRGVAWNPAEGGGEALSLTFALPFAQAAEACVTTQTVDEETCNPLKVWHDLGEPSSLNQAQIDLLRRSAVPFVQTERKTAEDKKVSVQVAIRPNGVVYFEVAPVTGGGDRGYDYHRVMGR